MMRTIALLLVSLMLVACSEASVIPSPQPFSLQANVNLLTNGDFEGKFYNYQDIGELCAAEGWIPWWDANSARPEYKDAAPYANRIASGEHAQQWFNTWNTHTAGIRQTVYGLEVGKPLSFSCEIQAWSTNANDPNISDGRYRMKLGIDPYGGIDAESKDIVWSDGGNAIQPYDAYILVTVATAARSDRATVFVWGQAEWALKDNNAYVDSCQLSVSDIQPTPTTDPITPKPSPTPQPDSIDYDRIRDIVREELNKTQLGSNP